MKRILILTALIVFTAVESAWAASGGGHGDGSHGGGIETLKLSFVNFGIYVLGLFLLLRGPFITAWRIRRETLIQQLESGKEKLLSAERQLSEAQQLYSHLEIDLRTTEKEILESGKSEAALLVEEAKRRAELIQKQAATTISADRKQAETQIRREIGNQVVAKARERLLGELKGDADRSLRTRVASGIQALVN